jgi:hypothetical protein
MLAAMGTKNAHTLQQRLEEFALRRHPDLAVVPAEVANTTSESLPYFKRVDLLKPVHPQPRVGVDAYFGDYTSSSPDVFVLPKDDLLLCTMAPGRAVFLSDGVTHHYAIIDWVDPKRRIVTLVDPWAPVSFMLPGHNVAGVSAHAYTGANGAPLLDLTFDDFTTLLHGSIEAIDPHDYFATMEKLYPQRAATQDYLVWKYTRLLASGDFDTELMTAVEINGRKDLAALPKLRLLLDYSNDEVIGVMTSFSVPAPGRGAKPAEIPALRAAFLKRLPDYATTLPWTLKWLLFSRTDESTDTGLRLAIIDAFLAADPHDTDFLIARADTMLRLHQPDAALARLDAAQDQWTQDVQHAIATPPDKALAFFFARNYGLETFDIMQWRYARIQLTRMIAQLQRDPTTNVSPSLNDLLDKYKVGPLLIDYFGELLEIAWRSRAWADETAELGAVIRLAQDDDSRAHIAEALYRQFQTLQPIAALPPPLRYQLRRSAVGNALCGIEGDGRIIPGMLPQYGAMLAAYCGQR